MAESIVDSFGNYTPLPNGSLVPGVSAVAGGDVLYGSGNPNTLGVTATPGTLFFNSADSSIWTTTNGTTWTQFTGGGSGTLTTLSGTGSPEGAVVGSPGWTFTQTDTGSFWVKKTGTATNTGWIEIVA
jgi:hypothetical protein